MAGTLPPPDLGGWPLEDAERLLAAAGLRWTVRHTLWTGRLPGSAPPGARPEGATRVLAQRQRGPAEIDLVVARFAYDARGRSSAGSPAGGAAAPDRQGG